MEFSAVRLARGRGEGGGRGGSSLSCVSAEGWAVGGSRVLLLKLTQLLQEPLQSDHQVVAGSDKAPGMGEASVLLS